MTAREDVLSRIATALGRPMPERAVLEVPRGYRRAGEGDGGGVVERFVERCGDYGATVTVVAPGDLAASLGRLAGGGSVIAAPGLDPGWLAGCAGVVLDDGSADGRRLDGYDTAVTACALAIAETGTIVLDHRPDQGRRALSLVPDHHVCVVAAGQIVASVPDAVAALDPRRVMTWVSGPSATSDIELDRVEGVHGPRRLDVLVVAGGR